MAFTQVQVSSTVTLQSGQPAANAIVSFTLSETISDGTTAVAPRAIQAQCNNQGVFTITLDANDDTTTEPSSSFYDVKVKWGELLIDHRQVIVPAADAPGPVDMYSLPNPGPPPTGPTYVRYIRPGSGVAVTPSSGTGAVTVSAAIPAGTYDAFGAAAAAQAASLQKSSNLSDLASASTARTNLGLGSAATQASTAFDAAGAASAAQAAAQAASIPLSQKGAASGVATLDSGSHLTSGQLPSSVVLGGSSGPPAWAASTAYTVNQLVTNSGTTYICNTAHTSGGTFSAELADWTALGGGGGVTLDTTATDIQMDGAQAAGSTGKAADAGHVHPTDTSRAPVASPTLTGTPAAPTAAADTNTTQVATTAFVLGQTSSSTPNMDGSGAAGTSTRYARADHTHPTDTSRAALASPTLTGTPAAPTAAADTSTTQLATTAFVLGQTSSSTPAMDGAGAAGSSTRYARADHVHPSDTSRAPVASPTFTGTPTGPLFAASGLTGATAASRYVGATASGAPASGTFAVGDYVIDQTAKVWICTGAGTPGTWTLSGTGSYLPLVGGTMTGTIAMGSHKITGLTNGSASTDAAAFGQIPVADGTASDIQPDGATAVAGSNGKWADSGHVHPASGLPKAGGLTGATAATRYVGGTTSGAPASGTFAVGDYVIDQTSKIWICTVAGSPGTWTASSGLTGPTVTGSIGTGLGSTASISMTASSEQWLVGLLNANLTVTISAFPQGSKAKIIAQQDSTGGRTLTVSVTGGGSTVVPVPAVASGSPFEILVESMDGTAANVIVTLLANPDASTTQKGAVILSSAPATATSPIVLAQNDPAVNHVAIITSNLTAIASQTTLQNATGLSFPIGNSATEIWFVEAWILASTANATMDIKFALTGPTGATGTGGVLGGSNGGWDTSGTAGTPAVAVGLGTAVPVGSVVGTSGYPLAWTIFGGGTAGTIQLQYAQNTSDAGNLQILAGSFLKYSRLHS